MRLDSRIAAVITGGASGLGEATARALGAKGVKVAIFDLQEELGKALAHDIEGLYCHVDVTDETTVETGFAHARRKHGQERVLVNCAGIGNAIKTAYRSKDDGSIRHFPIGEFIKIVQVNLIGTFRCIAKSAAGMLTLDLLEHGERGVILNTASIAAEEGQIGQAAYTASKAGVLGLTLPIARDLMSEGIRVNTILPGLFDTPMLGRLAPLIRDGLAGSVPFPKRLGDPTEYAHLAMAVIENSYVNGAAIRLDGALRMAPR